MMRICSRVWFALVFLGISAQGGSITARLHAGESLQQGWPAQSSNAYDWLKLADPSQWTIGPQRWLKRRIESSAADGGWLWGLGWGLGEGQVTVVDHEPFIAFPSRMAYFGGHISSPGFLGYLIPLSSFTYPCPSTSPSSTSTLPPLPIESSEASNSGCPKLCPKSPKPKSEPPWFALVQRGDCTFAEKSREAQRLGARAIVVGGQEGSGDELASMYSPDAADIIIPAVYISYNSYVNITGLISNSETTTSGLKTISVLLTSDPTWEWYSPILTFLILLLLPSSLTLCTLLIHRIRTARQERLERAPEEFVNSLPARVWTGRAWEKEAAAAARGIIVKPRARRTTSEERAQGIPEEDEPEEGGDLNASTSELPQHVLEDSGGIGAMDEDEEIPHPAWFLSQVECAICLATFEVGDRVRVLPCGHIFHLDEIDGWLIQRKKLCPVCKADVTINPSSVPGGKAASPRSPPASPSPAAGRTETQAMLIPNYGTSDPDQPHASSSTSRLGPGSVGAAGAEAGASDERTPLLGSSAGRR